MPHVAYRSPFVPHSVFLFALVCSGLGLSVIASPCGAITEEERTRAANLTEELLAAGELYAAGSFGQSAEKIIQVQQGLIALLASKDPALHAQLKPLYLRLLRARQLLELEGAQLDPLAAWDVLTAAAEAPHAVPDAAGVKSQEDVTAAGHVSFAQSVAPILLANCQGCHLGGRQAAGGLRLDTFGQLMRGGDSGAVIVAGKAAESLLVQKIRGEAGDRMPAGGRPALTADELTTISAWVENGAKFDGPSAELNLESVVAQAWAASADHQALFDRRRQRSLARWSKALPDIRPSTAQTDELFVLGNVPASQVTAVLNEFTSAIALAKKLLKAPADQPLLKGGLSVFVLKSRYDYSEFGRMTEHRELPQEWLGHWYADPLDTYGVLLGDTGTSLAKPSDKQSAAVALQIAVGAHVGSYTDVPYWFAEGVARNLVKATYRRDQRLVAWQQAYPAAVQKVDNAKAILEGRLDEETAGLVGMGITGILMERTNRRRFDQLLAMLRDGKSFDAACQATFASPEALVKSWLGK